MTGSEFKLNIKQHFKPKLLFYVEKLRLFFTLLLCDFTFLTFLRDSFQGTDFGLTLQLGIYAHCLKMM